jgi:hypothetical protein
MHAALRGSSIGSIEGIRAHTASSLWTIDLTQVLLPFGELGLGLGIRISKRCLDPAGELIVGEISPLIIDVAFALLPAAFYSIPVHFGFLT